jgi:LPXTG-motif cell wall-anchored protein
MRSSFHLGPSDQLARAETSQSGQTGVTAESQATGTSGTQELPSTGSALALYALLGGLSLAGALGLRAANR